MVRFNPPPGRPSPPEGWRPAPNWKPDPKWPQPPAGWQLWVDEDASHSLSHEGRPAPTPGVLARPSFADRMRGKWGWAAAALVCLLGLITGGFADALIFGGLTALILGVVAIIRESRRQGVRQRPGTVAALIAGGASVFIGGIASPSENAPVENAPTSMATSHPPQPPPTSQPTPSPTTKKSGQPAQSKGSSATFKHFKITVSRITQDGSRVRMLAKVCVRSLPRTPKAAELESAGIRGRFEQAQRQSTRAPPAQHSKRSSHRTPRIRSANAPRAGSRSRRMKRSREFGMRTVSAIGRSGTPLTYPPSRKQRRLSRSPQLGSGPRLTELPRIIGIARPLTATILTELAALTPGTRPETAASV
jgi:hypothetical protein